MQRQTMFPLMAAAPVLVLCAVVADALPGSTCSVKTCCDEWSEYFAPLNYVATLESDTEYTLVLANETSPACSLLALTANISDNATQGVCGDASETLEVSNVLEANTSVSSMPLVGKVIEPGTCQELSDSCWQSPNAKLHWTNKMYYQAGESSCYASWERVSPTVGSSLSCATEAPYGLEVSAMWVNGTSTDVGYCHFCCDAKDSVAPLVNITADMWTQQAGLPSWHCIDVPDTPAGELDHRIVLYTTGPTPCIPDESTGTVVSSATGLHGLLTVAMLACAFLFQPV